MARGGLPAVRGGAHPVGTENVLVRGPKPAYVELIAAGSGSRTRGWTACARLAADLVGDRGR